MSSIIFVVSSFLAFTSVISETIVSDNLGNVVGLPLAGGNATAYVTNFNTHVSTSPYILSVFVNNGENTNMPPQHYVPGTRESYWFHPPNNSPLYGNATLYQSGYSSTFSSNAITMAPSPSTYLGSPTQMINQTGLYQFWFEIPVLQKLFVRLTYLNAGAPQPVEDIITIEIDNPAVVVGDPQFVGLRGQSFQVHGIDGAVYNIITDKHTQVNSRFVFLTEGECPVINGVVDTNCWSHPGSYLGEMAFQQMVNGKLHQVLVVAGPAKTGFASISLDGKELSAGDSFTFGSFGVTVKGTHEVSIQTESFAFDLSNSDMFINQAVNTRVPLGKLTSHGLLGQTHRAKVYPNAQRYIEGEVDDYVIADNDIFGTDFAFNQFNL